MESQVARICKIKTFKLDMNILTSFRTIGAVWRQSLPSIAGGIFRQRQYRHDTTHPKTSSNIGQKYEIYFSIGSFSLLFQMGNGK